MSQNNKLNLWQKFKRLLTSAAPQSVIDASDEVAVNADINIQKSPQESLPTQKEQSAISLSKANDTDSKTSSASTTDKKVKGLQTPITDYLKQYFHKRHWHYTHYRPRVKNSQQSHHLSLRMKNKKMNCGYLFRVQEGNSLLAVYGILPFLIPPSHQSAAMLLITQINYDMLIGNLEMDVNDGEIRYKNAIDVEAVGMHDDIIEHLLQSVIAMTTVAYEIFSDLINTQDPSEDMPTLLGELRQQADARTFYLPTQKRQ